MTATERQKIDRVAIGVTKLATWWARKVGQPADVDDLAGDAMLRVWLFLVKNITLDETTLKERAQAQIRHTMRAQQYRYRVKWHLREVNLRHAPKCKGPMCGPSRTLRAIDVLAVSSESDPGAERDVMDILRTHSDKWPHAYGIVQALMSGGDTDDMMVSKAQRYVKRVTAHIYNDEPAPVWQD